ncbi:beta-ketoacyl-ACP synthase II [candidate division KSB3 bacterium]|uniref:Beta-ketoacyl-ACP synthase II n=1 Tax=candidate division KSB3 bacterium TaxID=2044937 RepID=A0A9D5JSM0_9BACT|nr:beta-ketoacyl-ACP synthase II [candidate division KSB3 bacterium]MBD3323507.1 beta-ketoacyl-ACP synthase II [candidate division KSB3 bacterium]
MRHLDEYCVAITGIGLICPLGITARACWDSMLRGESGISRITRFETDECLTKIGGELPPEYFAFEKQTLADELYEHAIFPVRLAFLCAQEAMTDSGMQVDEIDLDACTVITGSGGPNFLDQYAASGPKMADTTPHMLRTAAGWISAEYGFRGPAFNIATACASGGYAIGAGVESILAGTSDVCLAVGFDAMLVKESVIGFNQLMALSEENSAPEKASRPFDKHRSGFVLAEGGSALVLESYRHAVHRNARIYALISGYGAVSEAFNIVAPETTGTEMAKTMNLALQNAGIAQEEIGYVNAHGTSTLQNDLCETTAIKTVFGEHAFRLAVSSQKSMIGHTIGGAGAIECAATALALYHQILPPTINYEYPDPQCDLDYVPNQARPVNSLRAALSNSFGFGGHNCSLVLEAVSQ